MTVIALAFCWLISGIPAFALAVYSFEIAAGLSKTRRTSANPIPSGTIAVLIPAHNEAAGIVATLTHLKSVAPPGIRILVVADNCTDETANLARQAGAEVVERTSLEQRGKGFALSFGRDALAASPPDHVVVLDADCQLAPGSIERLTSVTQTGVPAQAANLTIPDMAMPALVQISSFAMLVKNLVRSRGLNRIGGCALLTGTGMAFPWSVFATAPLASGNIAEDMELGLTLARTGSKVRLVEQARVRSQASTVKDSATQRRRWEHGFLRNAMTYAAPLILEGITTPSRALLSLGLHLFVPPLALLSLISGLALAFVFVAGWATGFWLPSVLLACAIAGAVAMTSITWVIHGRGTLRLTALLQAPVYILWKVPIYLQFVSNRESRWQRTRRENED